MSEQRKRYLQAADRATEPRDRLFCTLMASIAPEVNWMARKNVNRVGASVIYDVVLRATSALLMETAFNLGRGVIDLEQLKADFAIVLDDAVGTQQVLQRVECDPKLDS